MSYAGTTLFSNPLIQLKTSINFRAKKRRTNLSARLDQTDPQLNLSVLRFTLGIPGWTSPTYPDGSDTEALGLSLAAFSTALPYLGKFLKGATPVDQTSIPEGCEQVFSISETTLNTRKEDLAWATYILLRNTNTISVIISVQDELCVRGYWSIPDDISKPNVLDWFEKQIKSIGLSNLKETLYLPQIEDSGLWEMLPKGTRSLLAQPMLQVSHPSDSGNENVQGFVLLASSMRYAYSDKDRAWAGALANKFKGK